MLGYKDSTGCYIHKDKFQQIRGSFETKNLQKIQKKNQGFWGWQKMPDIIKHYEVVGDYVKVPLGFFGFKPHEFEDRTHKYPNIILSPIKGVLTDEQLTAISSLMKQPVGMLHASTGTGKTWMVVGIATKLQKKTLIVCDAIGRMEQMRDDMEEILGMKFLTISGNKKKQPNACEDIVIGNIDSLIKMSKEDIDKFGLVLLDETDRYLQSDNRRKWIGSLSPKYLYGLTGTIRLNHIEDKVFPMYLGPKTELLIKNFIPNIHLVYTDFEYSDGQIEDVKDFHILKNELYYNQDRNNLIVNTIHSTLEGRKGIVFTEYVEHAKKLQEMIEAKGIKTYLIIGEISGEQREQIRQQLTNYVGPCILIGSKACIGRGFNVPELSVGYLTVTEKFTSSIEQYIGRVIRNYPGKIHADWYDFVDSNVNILHNQCKHRCTTYKREFKGCKIHSYFNTNTL